MCSPFACVSCVPCRLSLSPGAVSLTLSAQLGTCPHATVLAHRSPHSHSRVAHTAREGQAQPQAPERRAAEPEVSNYGLIYREV